MLPDCNDPQTQEDVNFCNNDGLADGPAYPPPDPCKVKTCETFPPSPPPELPETGGDFTFLMSISLFVLLMGAIALIYVYRTDR